MAFPVRGTAHRTAAVIMLIVSAMQAISLLVNRPLRKHWRTLWPKRKDVPEFVLNTAFNFGLISRKPRLSSHSYIEDGDRGLATARRAGVEKFLKDFLPQKPVFSLGEVLSRDALSGLLDQLGPHLVNDPKVDLFAVARLTTAQLPVAEARDAEYLRQNLPPRFFASFVPIGQGMIYFLWVPQGNDWRIYHASLVCM